MSMTKAGRISFFAQRPRLWGLVVAILLALQVGFLIHQSQHHLNPDVLAGDDCALCQIVSGMAAAPAAPAIILPVFVVLGTVVLLAPAAPRSLRITLSFRSRAPPASFSI